MKNKKLIQRYRIATGLLAFFALFSFVVAGFVISKGVGFLVLAIVLWLLAYVAKELLVIELNKGDDEE